MTDIYQVQIRSGTSSQVNTFTGAAGELTYDSDTGQLRVHDGSTVGGLKLAFLGPTFTGPTFTGWYSRLMATQRQPLHPSQYRYDKLLHKKPHHTQQQNVMQLMVAVISVWIDHNGRLSIKSTGTEQHLVLEQANSTTDGWGIYGANGGNFEISRMTGTTIHPVLQLILLVFGYTPV
jgi:hypothetical protein